MAKNYRLPPEPRDPIGGQVLGVWIHPDLRKVLEIEAQQMGTTLSGAAHHHLRKSFNLPTFLP